MIKRFICHFFGHCVYDSVEAQHYVPREKMKTDEWKYLALQCSRCNELCFADDFPFFVRASLKVKARVKELEEMEDRRKIMGLKK